MLTKEFVRTVADKSNMPVEAVRAVLGAVHDVAVAELKDRGVVRVPGIVSLRRIERSSRMARNPRTGEACAVDTGFTLKAKPVKAMIDEAIKEFN